uniref:Uncharacterized protein n=1 Tax=Encephalitozoon cuniculi TaxID=6035 RepID=M1K2M3_ENCCN|nr:hypothetical protein ECU08_1000 [Encephalitozoon cuniculi]
MVHSQLHRNLVLAYHSGVHRPVASILLLRIYVHHLRLRCKGYSFLLGVLLFLHLTQFYAPGTIYICVLCGSAEMGRGKKLFDIRSLFSQSTPPAHDEEEDKVYNAIEEKRRKSRVREQQRILTNEEVKMLEKMDIKEPAPKSLFARRVGEADVDENESACDNGAWKIHVLQTLIRKNRLNVHARIRLSRIVDGDEGVRILLEGRDIKDGELWREIIDRCYTPDLLDEALEIVDADEDFYIRLFARDGSIRVLRTGVERHPRSFELRRMLSENLADIAERQMFLYDCVLETQEERLADMFVNSSPDYRLTMSLHNALKSKGMCSDQILIYLLRGENSSALVEDLFGLGLERTLYVLRNGRKRLDLPSRILAKPNVLRYLETVKVEPMTALSSDLWSLFVSMSRHGLHDDETFISCYNVAKQHFLDGEFIDRFFVMGSRRYFVDLMKAREWWRLFMTSKDVRYFRKAEKTLQGGAKYYGKEKKMFVLARSKMYYMCGDYHSSYLAIPGKMKTIRKYVILAQINMERATEELREDLFDYKHWLLYAELAERRGMDACRIYEECMERYPGNAKVGIGYLRYLKRLDMEKALELSNRLVKAFGTEEWVWFERFVISRKLGRVSLPVLYNSRKHVRSELIDSEIRYYENKDVPEGNRYSGYYAYKKVKIRECNGNGMCKDCITSMKGYYRERILRDQDDGDNYILYYCVSGEVGPELRRMVEFFDPRGGDYWARIRNVVDIGDKLAAGSLMMNFDLLE